MLPSFEQHTRIEVRGNNLYYIYTHKELKITEKDTNLLCGARNSEKKNQKPQDNKPQIK